MKVKHESPPELRMRSQAELQKAHDVLLTIVRNEVPQAVRGLAPEALEQLKKMSDVLCWALRHSEGDGTFGCMLRNVEEVLARHGVHFIRDPRLN